MKKTLTIIGTAGFTLILVLGEVFVVYNFVPLSWFEIWQSQKLGATITTVQSTDTLKNSRATINTNFTNLNTDLTALQATTSMSLVTTLSNLATIGTITSGAWSGTVIPVAKGGTGTTTPTLNQVILGDTTLGFKVVNGLGTSGQFLTSQGAGSPPQWTTSAVDEAGDYTWTGAHIFSSTATLNGATSIGSAGTFTATGASTFNGLSTFNATSTQATSTISGLTSPFAKGLGTFTTGVNFSASSTVFSFKIPAGAMSTSTAVVGEVTISSTNANQLWAQNEIIYACLKYAGSYTGCTRATNDTAGGIGQASGIFKFSLIGAGATNSQRGTGTFTMGSQLMNGGRASINTGSDTVAIDSTAEQTLIVEMASTATTFNASSGWVQILKQSF